MTCFVVVPAWWHYDEPGHFEYVWLAAHSPTWPVVGQYDQTMRREMATSMLHYGWYQTRNIKPDLNGSEPIPIGVPQVGDRPGYYFLASLPLRLIPNADMTVQYGAARLISSLLFLLTIVVVWYALGEILPGDHLLRWTVTVFVAVLPAFVDTMVSVNNDVGAVLAASLFLWASLRLIQRGYSVGRILFLVASLAACYLSKSTAWFTFALAPVALILAILRGRFAVYMWSAAAVALIVLAVLAMKWGGPRAWYQVAAGDYPARIETNAAPAGKYAFEFDDSTVGGQILQIVPPDEVKSLRGKMATLGAWIWANQATQAGPFFIRFWTKNGTTVDSPQTPVDVTSEPAFHKIAFDVPSDAVNAIVYIQQTPHNQPQNNVFFDGLVLLSGQFGTDPPHFTDANGTDGDWAGHEFNNLLRNASAEEGSFQLRKWADEKTSIFFTGAGISLPLTLATVQDWSGTGWYFRNAAATLFRTFWASLAGDKAFLRSSFVAYFLMLLTMAGVAGSGIWLWVQRRNMRWDLIGFLGLSLLLPWLLVFAKGNLDFLQGSPLFPWARYGYPAILPTALVLCAGWLEWMEILPTGMKPTARTRKAIFLSIMLGISVFAIMNTIQAFHPEWWSGLGSLALLFLFQYVIFHFSTKWRAPLSS
jgi:hypothetical protein